MSLSPFGQSKLLQIKRGQDPRPTEATLDDFSGGLDLTESDLKLKTNFSKVEDNVHRDIDGTKSVRWGSKLLYNVSPTITGTIIDGTYYRDKLLVVNTTGQIATITQAGVIVAVWNTAIAAALPGAPAAWTTTSQVDFTEAKNELIIVNGVDKPLIFNKSFVMKYLNDVPTGSNVNTPIGKYVTTAGNYTVIAGVAATPDEIYISAAGTSGTWPGDPAPNDALSINIAAYTTNQGGDIRGLSSFRNFLVIHFATSSVVMVLGEYVGAVHKPRVLDTIPEHGVISHRCVTVIESEILYADELGVHKAQRNTFGNALESEKVSFRVQTDFIKDISSVAADRIKSYAVYNKLENRVMYFLWNGSMYHIYVISYDEGIKKRAWSKFSGWSWVCAITSAKGRVYFCEGTKIYQYGNSVFAGEDYTGDYMSEAKQGTWLTATPYIVGNTVLRTGVYYVALVAHTSGVFTDDLNADFWKIFEGEEIEFDWELPWTDTKSRMKKKRMSFIALDTSGTARFTVEVYVDNIRVDVNGDDDPALSLEFVAGSSPGFGGGTQPYGGGRRAADERLWGFPCEFKIVKFRIKGSTNQRLQVVAISMLLAKGSYKR